MPLWNLTYRIGVNCTLDEFNHEMLLLRGDRTCTTIDQDQSFTEPNVIRVRVGYPDWIGVQSHSILQRRSAEGVPAMSASTPRTQVAIDISDQQEGSTLQVGSPVYIDEGGRVGSRGAPIGVVMQVDNERHEAIVGVFGSGGGPPPLQVSRMVPNGQGGFDIQPDEFPRLYMGTPMTMVDAETRRARERIQAAEDARIFEVLDAMASKPPEPRPEFKTRYQRIMEGFGK